MMELAAKLRNAEGNMHVLLLAVKASGGYKYRERIPLSGPELELLVHDAERFIREIATRCVVAEHMLQEKPPHFHCRWQEYQNRLAEVLAK